MQSLLNSLLLWFAFFLTTVWGHIGLKLAIRHSEPVAALRDILSIYGITAILAWLLSAGFWAILISQQTVIQATSIANLRYPLICLSAVLYLGESISTQQLIGSSIILLGLLLFCQS